MADDIEKNNANVTQDGVKLGEEYDKARQERVDNLGKDSEKLGDNRSRTTGAVVTGAVGNDVLGTVTLFPGATERLGADDERSGGVAARAAKGLDTGDVTGDDTTWTAQSALPYVSSNAENVPGQTYRLEELPDPAVVAASGLPAHTIAEGLVVDGAATDDISSSQERPSDVGTAPQTPGNPSLEADAVTRAGNRASGRAQAKAGE